MCIWFAWLSMVSKELLRHQKWLEHQRSPSPLYLRRRLAANASRRRLSDHNPIGRTSHENGIDTIIGVVHLFCTNHDLQLERPRCLSQSRSFAFGLLVVECYPPLDIVSHTVAVKIDP